MFQLFTKLYLGGKIQQPSETQCEMQRNLSAYTALIEKIWANLDNSPREQGEKIQKIFFGYSPGNTVFWTPNNNHN